MKEEGKNERRHSKEQTDEREAGGRREEGKESRRKDEEKAREV